MKKRKQCRKLILLIAMFIILLSIINHNSIAEDSYYQKIGGKTEDYDGNIVQGVTVKLYKGSSEIASTQTDENGNYEFTNIEPGKYKLAYSYSNKEIEEINITRKRYEYTRLIDKEINLGFNMPSGYDLRELENKIKNAINDKKIDFQFNNTYDTGVAKSRESFSKELKNHYNKTFKKMSVINVINNTMTSEGNSNEGTTIGNFISTFNIYLDEESISKKLCDFGSSESVDYNYEDLVERLVSSYGAKREIKSDDWGNSDTTPEFETKEVQDNFDTTNINVKLKLKEEHTQHIGDFITGCVYLEDIALTDEEYNKYLNQNEIYKKVKVKLIKDDGTEIGSQEISGDDGRFGFVRPPQGIYKLVFEYNGQEYVATDATETNRDVVNNNCKPINNDLGKRIMSYEEAIVNIEAESNLFEIKDDIGQEGDPDYYREEPKKIDLHLKRRDLFNLKLEKQIDIVKVTLADGQVYEEKRSKNYGEEGTYDQVSMRQIIMDEELMHGATIEIEYLITATSNNMDIEEIKIIDYLDYENTKMEYKPDLKLLSNGVENSSLGWEVIKNKNELKNKYGEYIEQNLLDKDETTGGLKEREYLIGTLQEQDDGTYQIRLLVSKLIGSSLEDEELLYSNSTEIISYSNTEGRRIEWANDINLNNFNILGNFNPNYIIEKGIDVAVSEDVFIIPPFGRESNVFVNLNKYIEQKINFLNKEVTKK